jgi:hypothetical protein
MALPFIITIALLLVVLAPFLVGSGGLLQEANSINSVERLEGLRQALLQRYLQDEESFKQGNLSERAWKKRQEYLTNRYVDVTRRGDFLSRMKQGAQKT